MVHASVINGCSLTTLLLLCLNRAALNEGDSKGWTPLHHASHLGKLHAATILLRLGGNVEKVNNEGKSPLDLAVDEKRGDLVTLLRLTSLAGDVQDESFLEALQSFQKDARKNDH